MNILHLIAIHYMCTFSGTFLFYELKNHSSVSVSLLLTIRMGSAISQLGVCVVSLGALNCVELYLQILSFSSTKFILLDWVIASFLLFYIDLMNKSWNSFLMQLFHFNKLRPFSHLFMYHQTLASCLILNILRDFFLSHEF